jgi:hypothetical protein
MGASALELAPWIFAGWIVLGLIVGLLLVNVVFPKDRDDEREDDSWL